MILKDLFPRYSGQGADEAVTGITADSRQVQPGFVFAAMQGVVTDGRKFISKAVEAGAGAVLGEDLPDIAGAARINVDNACIVGGALLVCSLLSLVAAVGFWGKLGFGDLDAGVIVRAASVVVISASLGIQAITSGFLWGLLEQKIKSTEPASVRDAQLAPDFSVT